MEAERHQTKKELFVAIDHGLSFPETVGLERPVELLQKLAFLPEVDGFIATSGMYRQAKRQGLDLSRLVKLITVDCVIADEQGGLAQRKTVVTPEYAASLGVDTYKMFLNIYEDPQQLMDNIQDLSRFIMAGKTTGVTTLAEIIEKVNLPTYILGGKASPFFDDLLKTVASLKQLPIRGLMFGRNLWQYSNMDERVHLLAECLKD